MLRRPYFFCLYKRNRGKKIQIRGRAFYKAALPLIDPPPPKIVSLSGLAVGQGAPRPLPLPNGACAGSATQYRSCKRAVREGYIGEGACLCGSKVLAPPLWVVFLPTLFGQAKRVGPRREGNYFTEDDCQQERPPGVSERMVSLPYKHRRWCLCRNTVPCTVQNNDRRKMEDTP